MHTNMNGSTTGIWGMGRRGALIAFALAAGVSGAGAQTAQEATKPTSTVEIGAGGVTDGSYKAG